MADFIGDWRSAARPLLIVDEIRPEGSVAGEQLVSTVFVETDTRTAVKWAETALGIRDALAPAAREKCFKGATLYGSRQRSSHEPMREYVRAVLQECRAGFRVTTSNHVLRGHTSAKGGIRPVPATEADRLQVTAVRGPELVPLLNAVKVISMRRSLGAVQVDVLVDRSRQLGLDPKTLGVPADTIQLFGPETLNETSDGSESSLVCPSRFRIVSAPEEGRLRDLLLIPDAVAYQLHAQGEIGAAKAALASGEEFWVEEIRLGSLLVPKQAAIKRRHSRSQVAAARKKGTEG
jgi:hypothetical protein